MKVKAAHCTCCEYDVPYIISNEYSNKIIGVFGDSFGGLADIKNYSEKHLNDYFSHECSWLFYLGILSYSEVHSWGISDGSEYDILQTLLNNKTKYDYYIIFHTQPHRKNITTDKDINLYKTLAAIESITREKLNVLHLFWHNEHEVYTFSQPKYCIENILKKHPSMDERFIIKEQVINKNDQQSGHCHLSNRGNLLLAIELNKIIFSNDESN